MVGYCVGVVEGLSGGSITLVGVRVGWDVGVFVGELVGVDDGVFEGMLVGAFDGVFVGE